MATVLIVDDSLDVCKPLTRLLTHYGIDSEWVTSGEAALEYIRSNSTRLVLLDIMMPGISGFDVLRVMRADPEFSNLPVVMYSARSDDKSKDEARRLGANDYIVKSTVTFDYFLSVIRRHMQPVAQ
jgi:DNA-binding response OmpR family regulator